MFIAEIWDKFTQVIPWFTWARFLKFQKMNEVNLSQFSENKHMIPGLSHLIKPQRP